MTPNAKLLQALRDCCRDETAFETLQELLATMSVGIDLEGKRESNRDGQTRLHFQSSSTEEPLREVVLREQVEQALRESETKYRELVENANSIILRLDTQGNITFFNEFAQTFFGYTEAEILGRPALGTIIPETETSGRNLASLTQDLIEDPERYCRNENENMRRDGNRVWVAWTNKAILDATGQVTGVLCIGNDITERYQAQEALRASEARYRALSEELEQKVQERTAELTQANEQLKKEITERKRAQAALAKSEAWFKALIQGSTDMIDVLDREGNYIYVSPSSQLNLGVEPETLLGKSSWDEVHPDDLPVAQAAFEEILQNPGKPVQVTVRVLYPDRNWRYLEVVGRNLLDEPAVGGIVLNSRDITERQQAQEREERLVESLQTAKDQLQAILDTVPGCIFWIGSDLKYLGINRYLANIFHISPQTIVGQELGYSQSSPELREFITQFFATDSFVASQEIALNVDGSARRYLLLAQKYLQGKAAVCIGFDITELKATEESLRASEEKFAKAFRCCPSAISISTLAEGRSIEVNEAFLRSSGYRRDEVIGRTAQELNLWVNLADRDRIVQMLQQQGAIYNQEIEFRSKSGEILVGLLSAEIITLEGETCFLSLTNDITDRKRAEEQLREAAQRERLLGEIASRIRQSLDLNEILNTTVQEIRQFLQVDRVNLCCVEANPQDKIVAEAVAPSCPSCMDLAVQDENCFQELLPMFAHQDVKLIEDATFVDGPPVLLKRLHLYQIQAAMAVCIVVDEQPCGMLVVSQCSGPRRWQSWEVDLLRSLATQVAIAIKQARLYQQLLELNASLEQQVQQRTAQLMEQNQELQELNQLKDVFLQAVSHDLRNPVTGTLMVLRNLLNSGPSVANEPEPASVPVSRSVLSRMIHSSERQLGLINSLLEVHMVREQGVVVKPSPVQLAPLLGAFLGEMEPILTKNQATLTLQVSDDLPLVSADASQLWRVFENLITNALKYNPPGINLTISASIDRTLGNHTSKSLKSFKHPKSKIQNLKSQMIRCTVADDGVGITQEQCDRLFELYYRGSSTRRSTGFGLGLYLCQQIIKAHGGEIGAIGSPGAGATFWFTLPLVQHGTNNYPVEKA